MSDRDVAVFEALNHSRKEIFLGMAASPVPEFGSGRRGSLPAEVAHWETADEITFRILTGEMWTADARRFLEYYAFCIAKADWRIIRQAPAAEDRR